MKRTRIKPRSSATIDGAADREAVREAVFRRDRYRCQLERHVGAITSSDPMYGARQVEVPRCSGAMTFHHRRKAGAAGAYVEANGMTLCAGHNVWVEDEPDAALTVLPAVVVREGDPEWESLGKRAHRGY